jgi:predicted AlkP superfamily pyrophosphatase or phosphodiesterase
MLWLTLFGIAMGFLETSVVIYLRKIYYPGGFSFPLVEIGNDILLVEILREFATMIMLLSIGVLVGKTKLQRFAFFIFSFAVWDIFYYVFLKVLIDWPESFLTPDILFLIPVPWVGPVITPIILSISMIVLSIIFLRHEKYQKANSLLRKDWMLLISGSLIAIISFLINFIRTLEEMMMSSVFGNQISIEIIEPNFSILNWTVFGIGELLIVYAIIGILKKRPLIA